MTTMPEPGGAAGPGDLLARWRETGGFLFEQRGAGVLGAGEARRGVVPAGADHVGRAADVAENLLAAVGVPGALAVGALPFRGDVEATLTVPAHTVVTRHRPREVRLTGVTQPAAAVDADRQDGALPHLEWRAEPTARAYADAVAEAVSLIRAGDLSKVVLARSIVADHTGTVPTGAVLSRLRVANPDCHIFAAPLQEGMLLGASPETLVRKIGDQVLSVPLAGTAARSADAAVDRANAEALMLSAKDRLEHSVVVVAITDTLAPLCSLLEIDPQPRLIATATVWHLATLVRGTLRPSAPGALRLAGLLHPTPAVCGIPPGAAAEVIARLEGDSRGFYSGLVGWVDDRGDGEWALSLRCAAVLPGRIRCHAGAGIVAGSIPAAEVAETDAKLRTMLDVLSA